VAKLRISPSRFHQDAPLFRGDETEVAQGVDGFVVEAVLGVRVLSSAIEMSLFQGSYCPSVSSPVQPEAVRGVER
jgi:hypothetical protein